MLHLPERRFPLPRSIISSRRAVSAAGPLLGPAGPAAAGRQVEGREDVQQRLPHLLQQRHPQRLSFPETGPFPAADYSLQPPTAGQAETQQADPRAETADQLQEYAVSAEGGGWLGLWGGRGLAGLVWFVVWSGLVCVGVLNSWVMLTRSVRICLIITFEAHRVHDSTYPWDFLSWRLIYPTCLYSSLRRWSMLPRPPDFQCHSRALDVSANPSASVDPVQYDSNTAVAKAACHWSGH